MEEVKLNKYPFFKFYREYINTFPKRVAKKRMLEERNDVYRIQKEIWKTVRDHYIENNGGVYVSHIGYFCHIILPKRKIINSKYGKTIARKNTNGYAFRHLVLHERKKSMYFHIDKNLIDSLLIKLNKKEFDGNMFKFYYVEVFLNWIKSNPPFKLFTPKKYFKDEQKA